MKKFLCTLLLFAIVLSAVACTSNNTSANNASTSNAEMAKCIPLQNDQVLHIGNKAYKNCEISQTRTQTVEGEVKITYTLRRDYRSNYNSNLPEGYVEIGNYVYYFHQTVVDGTISVGDVTTKTTHNYEYIPFNESENILLKDTVKTEITYNYTPESFIEKEVEIEFKLNNYFTSLETLKENYPALFEGLDTSTTRKYYTGSAIPSLTQTFTEMFNTYFYID